ncbi:alpha-galactosidase [Cohnella sp. GbtcB17]|uniref:alpha-galactosidase n=1 Tax=Cohnella sp. GbtcB17 TaxID=2824762 RepID=UPI001C303B6B|nr:alpha-galactosidase [Cohnella sp. GbtcB17]
MKSWIIENDGARFVADNGVMRVENDLKSGTTAYRWADGSAVPDTHGEVAFDDRMCRTTYGASHALLPDSVLADEDAAGGGTLAWTIEHRGADADSPVLRQRFVLTAGRPYALTELSASRETDWSTREISPLCVLRNDGSVLSFGEEAEASADDKELRVLFVPFDNDKWVRYAAHPIPCDVESYEVTSIYHPASRRGFVFGSVSHDVWKTGVQAAGTFAGEIARLRVYGGAAGLHTRDTLRHGAVSGSEIRSPLVFVGKYDDYREGLESYGRANAEIAPALPWEGGVPFGWNSWSAVMDKLDADVYMRVSDFIGEALQGGGALREDDAVFVNFDAFWNHLTKAELAECVARVRANGQQPGIYATPFAYWGRDPEKPVEGFEGVVYRELLLKDEAGALLPTLDGAYAMDPTHPIVVESIRRQLARFVEAGFSYVKLDFLTHGTMEGRHYLPEIETGIQAYNYGMSVVREALYPARTGRPFFINLSIAPLFPHGYAHSRRISCDAFGLIGDTEYMLNALTSAWWVNDTLYRFNDPDHTVLYKSHNQRATSEDEGRSRLHASVIAGTSLLLGDDFRMPEAAARARDWLAGGEAAALARKGRTFVTVDGVAGSGAASVFALQSDEGLWLACFNYDEQRAVVQKIGWDRLPLNRADVSQAVSLYGGEASGVRLGDGAIEFELGAAASAVFLLATNSASFT